MLSRDHGAPNRGVWRRVVARRGAQTGTAPYLPAACQCASPDGTCHVPWEAALMADTKPIDEVVDTSPEVLREQALRRVKQRPEDGDALAAPSAP